MLDFSFIRDEQPKNSSNLNYAGGIRYDEFIKAQESGLIENHLDFYGDFRWSSQLVRDKRGMLTPNVEVAIPNLASILKQAFAAECGLVAFGD
jgi:hypothetical protein